MKTNLFLILLAPTAAEIATLFIGFVVGGFFVLGFATVLAAFVALAEAAGAACPLVVLFRLLLRVPPRVDVTILFVCLFVVVVIVAVVVKSSLLFDRRTISRKKTKQRHRH